MSAPIPSLSRRAGQRVGVACVAFTAWLCAPAAAQTSGFRADVRVVNFAPQPRREFALATVPFPAGVFTAGRRFAVRGVPSEVVPFGARWPDGSVRFAQLAVYADLAPHEERLFRVEEVTGDPAPFRYSAWVASRLTTFDATLAIGVPAGGATRIHTASLHPVAVIEDSPVRKTMYFRDRIAGTQFVYDLWLTFFTGQDSARFELRLTSSLIGSAEWEQPIHWAILSPFGAIPVVHGRTRLGTIAADPDPVGANPVLLLGPTSFFDGQAQEWFGSLAFIDPAVSLPDEGARIQSLLATLSGPLYGVATNWQASDAWGPFRYLPDPPAWITDGGRAAAVQSRSDFQQWYLTPGTLWEDRPLALRPYPAITGTQHDFGVGKFVDVFVSAMPHRIEEARFNAGEEAYRPVHFREPSGRPIKASDHPDWLARAGRTHWSTNASPDRLGKAGAEPNLRVAAHGWFGKDHEHWSSLALAAAYLLTGSHSLRMELDNDAELFLASHTLPSQRPDCPGSSIFNPRAVGRVMLTMSWNELLTARTDIADRMRGRVEECVIPQHFGIAANGPNDPTKVLPISVVGPDPRTIASGNQWVPWQEAQAVLGLEATSRVLDLPSAHAVVSVIARNLVTYGWRIDFDNTLIVYAERYLPGGTPIPASRMTDPEYFAWPSSPASFNIWSLPSTRVAILVGQELGDSVLQQRAETIAYYTERLRVWPRTGLAWDQYADWDCVR